MPFLCSRIAWHRNKVKKAAFTALRNSLIFNKFFPNAIAQCCIKSNEPLGSNTYLTFSSFNGNSSHLSYGKYLLTPITDGYTMTASNLDQKIFHSHLWWRSRIKFQDELQIKEISQKNVSYLKPFMVAKLYTWNTCDQ